MQSTRSHLRPPSSNAHTASAPAPSPGHPEMSNQVPAGIRAPIEGHPWLNPPWNGVIPALPAQFRRVKNPPSSPSFNEGYQGAVRPIPPYAFTETPSLINLPNLPTASAPKEPEGKGKENKSGKKKEKLGSRVTAGLAKLVPSKWKSSTKGLQVDSSANNGQSMEENTDGQTGMLGSAARPLEPEVKHSPARYKYVFYPYLPVISNTE
jgi:hypothetical protein